MANQTLTEQAYEYLHHKILFCEYAPGQELNEKHLLEETSFGRTPLREALLLLQRERLMEIYPRKGMRVPLFTQKQIDDLYAFRKLVEPTVIVSNRSHFSTEALLRYRKTFEQTAALSEVERFRTDADFHSYLISASENEYIINAYRPVLVHLIRLGTFAAQYALSNPTRDGEQHNAIIDALLRENAGDIRDAMILHLNFSTLTSQKVLDLQNSMLENGGNIPQAHKNEP